MTGQPKHDKPDHIAQPYIQRLRDHLSVHWEALLALALLASVLLWHFTEENRLEKRFATGLQVDTAYAVVLEKDYFKNDFTYKIRFEVKGRVVLAKLRHHSVPNLEVGWKIPVAYLEDEVDEIRYLQASR